MDALRWRALLGCATVVACAGGPVAGGVVTLQVDPVLSRMHLVGGYSTSEGLHVLQETISGSLQTQLGGTLRIEVDTTPIGFRGGEIVAAVSGTYAPGPQPANYGFTSSIAPPVGAVQGLLRDFAFSISGEPTPLFNGFDMMGTDFLATSGVFETDTFDPIAMAGRGGAYISGNGSVFRNVGSIRVQFPFTFSYELPVPDEELTMQVSFVGFLVADGTTPEPASALLLAAGTALACLRRHRPGLWP